MSANEKNMYRFVAITSDGEPQNDHYIELADADALKQIIEQTPEGCHFVVNRISAQSMEESRARMDAFASIDLDSDDLMADDAEPAIATPSVTGKLSISWGYTSKGEITIHSDTTENLIALAREIIGDHNDAYIGNGSSLWILTNF